MRKKITANVQQVLNHKDQLLTLQNAQVHAYYVLLCIDIHVQC